MTFAQLKRRCCEVSVAISAVTVLGLAGPLACLIVPSDEPDAGPGADAGGDPDPCLAEFSDDTAFELLPAAPDTQIHAAAAYDGRAVWLTYSLPDGSGGFDIYATRLGCDGATLLPAFLVNTTTGGNDLDSDLSISGDQVSLAWHSDNGTGIDNMDVFYRTFNADGTPIMASDRTLETSYDGDPVTGNVMNPIPVMLADGQFAITASRGLPVTNTFQAFIQVVDRDGELVGSAVDAFVEDGAGQMFPTIAATAGGDLLWAWSREEVDAPGQVQRTRLLAGTSAPDPATPDVVADSGIDGAAPHYAVGPDGHVYLAFSQNGDITLMEGDSLGAAAPSTSFGISTRSDYAPRVVPVVGGGVVFWYRNITGFQNQYLAQPFRFDGSSFSLGQPVEVTTSSVPPYAPAATHIAEDLYFAAWSEGTSPSFRMHGRFLRLPL